MLFYNATTGYLRTIRMDDYYVKFMFKQEQDQILRVCSTASVTFPDGKIIFQIGPTDTFTHNPS